MLKISDARIFDPVNGKNGEYADLWIEDGKIISEPANFQGDVLDATGNIVMAGAIDIHSHICGYPLQLIRESRSKVVPGVKSISLEYLSLGYTSVVNAAVPALSARQTILEETCGGPDKMNLVWLGENQTLFNLADTDSDAALQEYISFLLDISAAYGLKCINPCAGATINGVSSEKMIDRLIDANESLSLPHSLHLHHPFLGQRDAWKKISDTVKRTRGRRLHLAHLQFYAYKSDEKGWLTTASQELAHCLNDNSLLTSDVGAVVFGPAVVATADAEFASYLGGGRVHNGLTRQRWEEDGTLSVLPLEYKHSYVGSVQWLAGLELLLLTKNPEQCLMTTDYPNGGPFSAYPYLIRLLMDKAFRDEEAKKLDRKALSRSCLKSIQREFSLSEIARLTRSGPASSLGLANKGQLGVGADADLVIYSDQIDREQMFREPLLIMKGGEPVGLNQRWQQAASIWRSPVPEYDRAAVKKRLLHRMSVDFDQVFLSDRFLDDNRVRTLTEKRGTT
ncbi:MAG TPA: amidohydrolase family protein [Oscillospiraceae bacterium]|nr:amidohydrolase family protein [Oscillospiraceae bacterium]